MGIFGIDWRYSRKENYIRVDSPPFGEGASGPIIMNHSIFSADIDRPGEGFDAVVESGDDWTLTLGGTVAFGSRSSAFRSWRRAKRRVARRRRRSSWTANQSRPRATQELVTMCFVDSGANGDEAQRAAFEGVGSLSPSSREQIRISKALSSFRSEGSSRGRSVGSIALAASPRISKRPRNPCWRGCSSPSLSCSCAGSFLRTSEFRVGL